MIVTGLLLFTLPWIVGVIDNWAAWTAWIVGAIALILASVDWLRDEPATEYGVEEQEYGIAIDSIHKVPRVWVGRFAFAISMVTVVLAATVTDSSTAGSGLTVGLGCLIAIFALWSLLAVDPTHDHWALTAAGFALFLAPWMGGFVGTRTALVAWIAGSFVAVFSGVAYLLDDSSNRTRTVHDDSVNVYRNEFR